MKNTAIRVAAVGAVAALIASIAPLTAQAATTPTYDATTDAPIYLMDGTTALDIPDGTQMDWNFADGVILTASRATASSTEDQFRLPAATGAATNYMPFLSAPGSERTPSAWKAWADPSTIGTGALEPSVWPGNFNFGTSSAVKASGGTFSMGVAYTDSAIVASTHVVKAYYVKVNIDAGTGKWTFATKTDAPVNTDVPTTTTLAATPTTVEAGNTAVLTATVSASKALPASNVEFYNGATKIGAGAVANGTASYTANVNNVGANTFSAKYVENVVNTGASTTDTFKASTSADVTVTGTTPAVAMPPKAPSDNALNVTTANGATAIYDAATHKVTLSNIPAAAEGKIVNAFAYSSPTYVGSPTVTGGAITVSVSTLAAGTHNLAITDTTTGDVIAWASFSKTDAAISPSISKQINADVINGQTLADGEFSLTNDSGATVNLTNPTLVNGESVVSGELGKFHVTDLRQVTKPGWNLSTTVADFTKGTDTINKSALGITPKLISNAGTGATAPSLGTAQASKSAVYPWDFAALAAGGFSGVNTYNADLVFTAPAGKPAGTYSSTLTLTLISK
jgi:hypothetical protein